MNEVTYPAPTELTLEGLIASGEVKSVLIFNHPLTHHEAMLVKAGWEAGLRAAQNQEKEPNG